MTSHFNSYMKYILILAVGLLASCTSQPTTKAAQDTTAVDSTVIDTLKTEVVDSTSIDTLKVDTIK